MTPDEAVLVLAVFLPFLAVPGIVLLRHRPNVREGVSLAAAIATFGLNAALLPALLAGTPVSANVLPFYPGLAIEFRADALGLLFSTVSSFLWILTTVYSIGYMRGLKEHAQTRYYACFALVIGSAMGVALSSSLFSLLIFYEALTVSTYPLVIHKETDEAYRAGRKYLTYTLGGGGAILAGLAIVYALAGDVSFAAGGNASLAGLPPTALGVLQVAAGLLIAGFGVKSTLMPLHGWLPTAMIAPTPVSGLLHAVAVVKAGVFGIVRTLLFLLGPGLTVTLGLQPGVLAVASFTILVASLFALLQDNLKLLLAYSTVSQLSYIVLGAALLSPNGIVGSAAHIAAHAFAKLTMFFVAGILLVETGKTRISELRGVGRQMPGTMAAFAVAALALIGIPPLAPFVSKGYLAAGAAESGAVLLPLVLAASAVLNVAYFLPIVVRAFGGASPGPRRERGTMLAPLVATATGAVVLGVWTGLPGGPFALAGSLPSAILPGHAAGFDPLAMDSLLELGLVAAAAAVVVAVSARRLEMPSPKRTAPERGILWLGRTLAEGFSAVYASVVASVDGLGRRARRTQTGDLNWNAIGLALGLLLVLAWLLGGSA